ncbi:MAG: hypothetical protein HWN65_09280 [Candidatus Helarchaeota archaeon]|nr:hypothetical protein [Candidatus Helarchaeota archaeon]
MYFTPDEKPLFKVRGLQWAKFDKILRLTFIGMLLGMLIAFATLIIATNKFPYEILILFVPLLIASIIMLSKFHFFRVEHSLCITDKKIYLYSGVHERFWVNSTELASIKAMDFEKKKSRIGMPETGKIEFVMQDYETRVHSIMNIPNLHDSQKIIESILYEYGNIRQRWDALQEKFKLQFPYKFNISSKKLDAIRKRRKRLNLYLMVGCFLTLLIGAAIYLILPIVIEIDVVIRPIVDVMILVVVIIIVGGIILGTSVEKYLLRKRSSPINSTITLNSQQVTLSNNITQTISMSPDICLNYLKIREPFKKYKFNWNTDAEGIVIKSAIDSDLEMKFGPIDNFPEIFEIFFCYFIIWKAEHGFLLSKDQITTLKEGLPDQITEASTEKFAITTSEVQDSKEISFHPIDLSSEIYQSFRKYLDPDERILLSYKPMMNLKLLYLKMALALIFLILSFAASILGDIYSNIAIVMVGILLMITSIPMLFCFCCSGDRLISKAFYVFTNKKIIWKYSNKYILITYDNISSIIRRDKKKTYEIDIKFKKPLETSPFMDKYTLNIPKIPYENNLIIQLTELRKGKMFIN